MKFETVRILILSDVFGLLSFRAQLFESRLALNPRLNLTRVSFSWVQKHFVE